LIGVDGGKQYEINKDLNSDKVMRNMVGLIKRVEKEREEASEALKKLRKE
jgi:hypothetical protein